MSFLLSIYWSDLILSYLILFYISILSISINIYIYLSIHLSIYLFIYLSIYLHTHTYMNIQCIYIYVYIYTYWYVYWYIYINIYRYIYIYIYIYYPPIAIFCANQNIWETSDNAVLVVVFLPKHHSMRDRCEIVVVHPQYCLYCVHDHISPQDSLSFDIQIPSSMCMSPSNNFLMAVPQSHLGVNSLVSIELFPMSFWFPRCGAMRFQYWNRIAGSISHCQWWKSLQFPVT